MTKEITFLQAKPISEEKIREFESFFDLNLPEDFKEILAAHNGAYVFPESFYCQGNVEGINKLVSFNIEDGNSIYVLKKSLEKRLSPELIPFGEDSFGNLICFDSKNNNSVVFWDHEATGEDPTKFICSSFSEFLGLLEDIEE